MKMLAKYVCSHLSRQTKQLVLLKLCNSSRLNIPLSVKLQTWCRFSTQTSQKPLKVKLDTATFQSILNPEILIVKKLFDENGHELRIVGGAVRDLLMGQYTSDLDLCTMATPPVMIEMFERAGIRILYRSGEKHGTVSVRVNDKENLEITTLRTDLSTDGRRAVVQFVKDWRLDAERRDLTINSLFLDFDGYIHDYFNGIEDVKNRKLRFVNDPVKRIREDYLRILRYFRFYGRIASCPNDHDEDILKAIKHNAEGLDRISGERINMEFSKIVCGRFASEILRTMHETDVTKHIGLPENLNFDEVNRVCKNTENQPEPMLRIAALLSNEDELEQFHARVKLSNKQKSLLDSILRYRDTVDVWDLDCIIRHFSLNATVPSKQLQSHMSELCRYHGNTQMAEKVLEEDVFPEFEWNIRNLSSAKGIKRKYSLRALEFLRAKWVESGYTLGKEELLELIDQFIEENKDKYPDLFVKKMKK